MAAGLGTRMNSTVPKVLHSFAGRSLLGHTVAAVSSLNAPTTAVVVGYRGDEVTDHLRSIAPNAQVVIQDQQNGTGHAVRVALQTLGASAATGTVLVLPGDTP